MLRQLRPINMESEKRELRKLKRVVKRAGNKRLRQRLKRDLIDDPEEAAHSGVDFGRNASAAMNGLDRDSTRRRREDGE